MVKIAIQSNRNPKYPTKSRSIPIYIYTKVYTYIYIYNNSQLKSPLTSQQIVPMVVFLSNHHFKILFNPKYPHYIPLNKKNHQHHKHFPISLMLKNHHMKIPHKNQIPAWKSMKSRQSPEKTSPLKCPSHWEVDVHIQLIFKITILPSGKLTVRYGKSPCIFNGKIHDFYGHFQVRQLLVYQKVRSHNCHAIHWEGCHRTISRLSFSSSISSTEGTGFRRRCSQSLISWNASR